MRETKIMNKKTLDSNIDVYFSPISDEQGEEKKGGGLANILPATLKASNDLITADIYLANGNIIFIPIKPGLKRIVTETVKIAGRVLAISSLPAAIAALPVTTAIDAMENSEAKKQKIINDRDTLCEKLKLNPNEAIICNSEVVDEIIVTKPEKNFIGFEVSTVITIIIKGDMSIFGESVTNYRVFFFIDRKSSHVTHFLSNYGINKVTLVD